MSQRRALLVSHVTPEDNAYTIWLGASSQGSRAMRFGANVLRLKGGDDWQRKLEDSLRP